MMQKAFRSPIGVELLLERVKERFPMDAEGRIVGSDSDGLCPRFLLGRAVEGCIWRFGRGVPDTLVVVVAKLAGREPGLGERAAGSAPPPERLAAIERVFAREGASLALRRELVEHEGVVVGELWIGV